MVTFSEVVAVRKERSVDKGGGKRSGKYVEELELELKRTKEHLRTSIEELETANEELRSMNEEYQSTNEELQSSNEELNTSREELQSLNEELETVNAEFQNQITGLQNECVDMRDLLDSLQVPIILLDAQLRILRFTSSISRLINVISSDIGRPFSDIVHRLDYPRLAEAASEVLETLVPKTVSARSMDGNLYDISVRPLRGSNNVIGGVLLSFFDASQKQQSERRLEEINRHLLIERQLTGHVFDTLREALLILDSDLRVSWANRVFYELFSAKPEETVGKYIYDLGDRQWDNPKLRQLLEEILPKRTVLLDYQLTHGFPAVGTKTVMLNARQLDTMDGDQRKILLVIEDVTRQQR